MTAQQKYDALWERIEAIAKNTTEVILLNLSLLTVLAKNCFA